MANSGYYTEPKLNSTGGGSSLTIREADGTPSGVVTELVFPNGTISIASGVGTLTLVGDADSRLGVVYDTAEGLPVLSVLDATWSFLNNTYRDNFRTAIDAAAASHTHGNISNAGAIGSTADLPISTTASGVLAARTVADFRGLLGLATTDSPTFAGLTLGTSGILVGGTNLIEQRNGTNAQISRIYKTFTSTTNFETFEIDAASDASNYRIGSRIGSAGGTTRGLQLGRYDGAGTWTSWLSLDTFGQATILSNIVTFGGLRLWEATNFGHSISHNNSIDTFELRRHQNDATGVVVMSVSRFSNTVTFDLASGAFNLNNLPTSVTPSTNGQFSIEMTSNTAGNLVYRGSDGTTRRMALTFS